MPPAPAGSLRTSGLAFYQELKAVTRPLHDRLEASPPLLDPHLTIDAFRAIMRRFYGIYAPLEALISLAACEAINSTLPRRIQTEWLEQDLCALGHSAEQLAAIPRCSSLPSLNNRAELLGTLYVINGATLGSQIIVSSLRTSLGEQALGCTRFFESYGDQIKPMWRTFLEVLVRTPETGQEQRAIIQSACDIFRCFEQWFGQRPGPMSNCDADGQDRMIVQ